MSVTCPRCSSENAQDAARCTGCGAKLIPATEAGPQPARRRARVSVGTWGYRTVVVLLLLALALTQAKLWLARRDLRDARTDLEHARATIEQAISGSEGILPEMQLLPPDGQPTRLGKKLAQCLVEEVTFAGSQVTLRVSNPSGAATQPFVRVVLFDAYGRQVGDGVVVDYRSRSFRPAEAKSLSDRVSLPPSRPRYFLVTDRR